MTSRENKEYSCFEEGCPTKPYRDNAKYYVSWRFTVLDLGFRCYSDIEGNSPDKCIYALSFLVGKHCEPQSIKAMTELLKLPQTTQNMVISLCCFAEDGKEMYKEL